MRARGRLREELAQGEPELRRRLELAEAERVHEHEPAQSVALVDGEAGRDGAAEQLPDQRGRRHAGPLDQLAEPREHALGVQRAVRHLRGAVARQVGGDDAMGRHEARDHAHPMGGVPRRAVQQDDRRAVAALQHGGRDAGQLQPSLRDRQPRQQPFPSVLADRRSARGVPAFVPEWPWPAPSFASAMSFRGRRYDGAPGPRFGGTTQFAPRRRRG